MSIKRLLERSLRRLERAQGEQTFAFRGKSYPCTVSTLNRGHTLDLGGFDSEIQMTIHVRKSAIPVMTVDDVGLTVESEEETSDNNYPGLHPGKRIDDCRKRQYRIARVREDGAGVFWALDLVDPSK
jgi:hypothetical protein